MPQTVSPPSAKTGDADDGDTDYDGGDDGDDGNDVALPLHQTVSFLSAKTGDHCDDDWWADVELFCAFLFICFSPA